jgi:hypothetical protein
LENHLIQPAMDEFTQNGKVSQQQRLGRMLKYYYRAA